MTVARIAQALSCIVGAFAAAAHADTVHLNNGDRLTGTVTMIDSGNVRLETEYSNAVIVALDHVATIETEAEYQIGLPDGASITGRLTADDGSQAIRTAEAETPFALGGVTEIRRAGRNRIALTSFDPDWSSRADLAASVATGNSDTESLNMRVETGIKRGRVEHNAQLNITTEEADGETTRDILDLDYGYKRFISERWFASGNGEYFQDQLKDVDQRVTLGAGMGYQAWDNSFGALSMELGVNVVVEEIDGDREENPALRWGLKYNRFLWNERLEFFHNHSILAVTDADRGEIIQADAGLRFVFNEWLDGNVRAELQHETEPAPGNHKSDITYSVGVGVKF